MGIDPGGQERSDTGIDPATPGTVNVELGGLARTDNSGWGEELETLARRLGSVAED
jgi:cytochrome c biogenesis protein